MIKESLKKSFEILRESTSLFLLVFVFHVLASFFISFFFTGPAPQFQGAASMPSLITASSIVMILYFYLHAGTLAYVHNKINFGQAPLSIFFSSGFKYLSPLILFQLAFFLPAIIVTAGIGFIFIGFLTVSLQVAEPSQTAVMVTIGGFCILFIMNICWAFLMLYAPTIIVADSSKVYVAMKKSAKIVWKYIGVTLGLLAINAIFYLMTGLLSGIEKYIFINWFFQVTLLFAIAFWNTFFEIYVSCIVMNIYLRISKQEIDQKMEPIYIRDVIE